MQLTNQEPLPDRKLTALPMHSWRDFVHERTCSLDHVTGSRLGVFFAGRPIWGPFSLKQQHDRRLTAKEAFIFA